MKPFIKIFFAFALVIVHARFASANCADIGRESKDKFAALTVAKDIYKQEALQTTKRPPSQSPNEAAQVLAEAIASTEKMKRAIDAAIDVLVRAQTQKCFGKDADKWSEAIVKFRHESNELGKTHAMFVQQRSDLLAMRSPEQFPAPSSRQPSSEPEKPSSDDKRQRDEFRETGTCVAYWRISSDCLHVVATRNTQEVRLYFDMLIETMSDRLSELGRAARISSDAQERFVQNTQQSMLRSVGGKCDGFVKLVPTYRDNCAALVKAHAARVEESLNRRPSGR